MAKKRNRKKQLKKQLADLRRKGRAGLESVVKKTETVVEQAVEQVKQVVADIQHKENSLEEFLAIPDLEGVTVARLETFYQEGIRSIEDFANHTEKELLAFKGIGPATIKQLKEKGIVLKG